MTETIVNFMFGNLTQPGINKKLLYLIYELVL